MLLTFNSAPREKRRVFFLRYFDVCTHCMASAQLLDPPAGLTTPSRVVDNEIEDLVDHRVTQNEGISAEEEDTEKVVESLDSSVNARRKISSRRTREDDDISLIDDTENEMRQRWSAVAINDENKSLKRVETVPEKGKSRNKHMKVVTSSSSDNSSSSNSESSEDSDSDDNAIFDPGHSKVFDKKKRYLVILISILRNTLLKVSQRKIGKVCQIAGLFHLPRN